MVVGPEQCGGPPLSKDIRAAIEEVLKDKDLDTITMKELRRTVVSHMDIGGKWFKRSLEGSRRDKFQLLAPLQLLLSQLSLQLLSAVAVSCCLLTLSSSASSPPLPSPYRRPSRRTNRMMVLLLLFGLSYPFCLHTTSL